MAALESYIGLVEAGVGLLPAGGGLKEFAVRASQAAGPGGDVFAQLKPYVRSGGDGARCRLRRSKRRNWACCASNDVVVFNAYELLHVARQQARALAEAGYRPPLPARSIQVAGDVGIATFKMMLVNMLEGRFISQHDYEIATRIATVLCGGEVDRGALVDEDWLLRAGARALRRAGADAQDPGADRAHAARPASRCATERRRGHDMTKQIQDAYIVAATRTPVGKAPRGVFRNTRPDDLLAHVLQRVVAQAPGIDPARIEDVIIGCAMPEGEQGMNVARIGVLLAGLPEHRRRA